MGEDNDDPDNLMALQVGAHAGDKASVDFQRVHRKALKTGKGGIAGAEVIDAQPYAETLQLREHERRTNRVTHRNIFGNLEIYAAGIDPCLLKALANVRRYVRLFEFPGRHIYAHEQWRGSGKQRLPAAQLLARLAQQAAVHWHNEAGFASNRDEFRGHSDALRALPASQGFEANNSPILQ